MNHIFCIPSKLICVLIGDCTYIIGFASRVVQIYFFFLGSQQVLGDFTLPLWPYVFIFIDSPFMAHGCLPSMPRCICRSCAWHFWLTLLSLATLVSPKMTEVRVKWVSCGECISIVEGASNISNSSGSAGDALSAWLWYRCQACELVVADWLLAPLAKTEPSQRPSSISTGVYQRYGREVRLISMLRRWVLGNLGLYLSI